MNQINQIETQSVYDFLKQTVQAYQDKAVLFGRSMQNGESISQWYSVSYKEVLVQSEILANKIIDAGLEKGDRVILIAKSCPEFSFGFFAIPLAGGVIVPLDIRLSLDDQHHVCDFSEAKYILCLDEESVKIATNLVHSIQERKIQILKVSSEKGDFLPSTEMTVRNLNQSCIGQNELMLMSFTSGTTSAPKAVMLNWSNLYFQIHVLSQVYVSKNKLRVLSILPVHHMFELTCGFLLPFATGGEIFYSNSLIPHQVLSFFKEKQIREIVVVPIFLRMLRKGILSEVNSSKIKKVTFAIAYKIASVLPSLWLRRMIFFPLYQQMGGQLQQIISGASGLDPKLEAFFSTLGIAVYEGYGMTEASPVISCNSRHNKKTGSLGKPLAGLEIKLDDASNEILVRGPSVMMGYFKDSKSTQESITSDGWLKTGDIGSIDKKGFLSIQGRNKDIIVLGNGKKVFPAEIEKEFKQIVGVQDICILGMPSTHGATEGTDIVTAVVALQPDATQTDVYQQMQEISLRLSYFKRPAKIIFLNEPFPKTATFKIKKNELKDLLLKKRITL